MIHNLVFIPSMLSHSFERSGLKFTSYVPVAYVNPTVLHFSTACVLLRPFVDGFLSFSRYDGPKFILFTSPQFEGHETGVGSRKVSEITISFQFTSARCVMLKSSDAVGRFS